jgi:hypothetical protein
MKTELPHQIESYDIVKRRVQSGKVASETKLDDEVEMINDQLQYVIEENNESENAEIPSCQCIDSIMDMRPKAIMIDGNIDEFVEA